MGTIARSQRHCAACGRKTEHREVFVKWDFPILCCDACGMGCTGVPESFDPSSIYTRDYFQGGRRDGYADYAGSEAVLRIEFQRAVAELRRFAPAEGRLLEVGCAYGFFLEEASRFYDCQGVELSAAAAEVCRAKGLRVHCGGLQEFLATEPKKFHIVVLLDVIEHLPEPDGVLAMLAKAMEPGAIMMIATGDWGSLLGRLAGKHWRLMTPPQHLCFFSVRTLSLLLERSGFKILCVSHPWKRVPLGLMAYQLGNRLGVRWRWLEKCNGIRMPVNLFDAMRVVARKA